MNHIISFFKKTGVLTLQTTSLITLIKCNLYPSTQIRCYFYFYSLKTTACTLENNINSKLNNYDECTLRELYRVRSATVSNVTQTADVKNNVRSVYLLMIVLTVFVGRVEQGRYVSLMMSDDLHPQVCSTPPPSVPEAELSGTYVISHVDCVRHGSKVSSRGSVKIIILGGRLFFA